MVWYDEGRKSIMIFKERIGRNKMEKNGEF